MVCQRCIAAVSQVFAREGIPVASVDLGTVELQKPLKAAQRTALNESLGAIGFEILDDQKQRTIERIKNHLVRKVQSGEVEEHFSVAAFLRDKMHRDHSHLSRLFSEVAGITIEQFFIQQKIEKVKEWLVYDELTLSEIAWKLGYSSVAHLSAQFKKITGLTPSQFRKVGGPNRRSLDEV